MKLKKKIFLAVVLICIGFFIQNRIRNSHDLKHLSVAEIENIYEQGCTERDNTIVPCNWYTETHSPMPAFVAGMLDGAYISGESIADLALLTWNYSHNAQYRSEVNEMASLMWQNRYEVYQELKTELQQYGQSIAGYEGALEAEYQFGRLVFEVGFNFVGIGSISGIGKLNASLKTFNKGKWLKRMEKMTEISLSCKTCATIFNQSKNLRKNILKNDLDDVKLLLDKEWKTSGKTWDNFIKDYDAHHVIPVDLLIKSEVLKTYYNSGGALNFNSFENGILLKSVNKAGIHANHPNYTNEILDRLNSVENKFKVLNLPNDTKISFYDKEIRKIILNLKSELNEATRTGTKVNNLFEK